MRKGLLIVAALVAVLGVLATSVVTTPALRDEAEWRWAAFRDGEADYAAYVRERPGGRHADEARSRYDEKTWQIALKADTIPAFEHYLRIHADGRFTRDATGRIDSLHWEQAQAADTLEAYRSYLSARPDGAHVAVARKRFKELRWEQLAGQIADLACDGAPTRRIRLYRAPSLYRTQEVTQTDPSGFFYQVTLRGAPGQGYQQLARSSCKELTVLGAADYAVRDLGDQPTAKWVFAALRGDPSVRGWVYVPNAFNPLGEPKLDWSDVPRVPVHTLLPRSNRLPDLVFGSVSQAHHVGEPCPNGNPNVWTVIVRNGGQGVGPPAANLRVSPTYETRVQDKVVDSTRVLTFPFARPLLPGESLVFSGLPASSRLELDPAGRVAESDEGNNGLSLGGLFLTCGQ
jgi:hypothetical protein